MNALEYINYLKEINELINQQGSLLMWLSRFIDEYEPFLTNNYHMLDKLFTLRENVRRFHEIFSKFNKLYQIPLEIADDVAFKAFEFKINEIRKVNPMQDDTTSEYSQGFEKAIEMILKYLHYKHVLGTLNEYNIIFDEIQNIGTFKYKFERQI
jgi:hypothetical protein